ncbi:MAG TPA: SWIM zinc finger family protein [Ktedonobacteraceae bacterium]|nr:SWIM zinc finger family protein [Ktedonobacteraceae bacterium]
MGRWDDYEDTWNYYRPGQPIKVEGGLKARSKQGAIGSTWWSRRWIHVLESFSMGTRLTRGRSYARQGQVVSIEVQPGLVQARVQGSQPKPYTVMLQLQPLGQPQWERVIDAMAEQALFAAKLLAGEMPEHIEEAFSAVDLSLFPTREKDLVTYCSCPDWANPCKHVAAVYYLLAERFDEDPFLIFKLRGRDKEEIIQSLRARRTATLPPAPAEQLAGVEEEARVALADDLETFWQAGDGLESFTIHPGPPGVDKAVLKRLGTAPFAIHAHNLTTLLARAYDAVDEANRRDLQD